MHEHDTPEPRSDKPGRDPWCWQHKHVLDRIRAIEGERKISALAVYLALTELASDAGSQIFDAHVSQIMAKSGVSDSTARKRIADLAALEVIHVRRNYLNATTALASTFTLLPSRNKNRTPPVTTRGCEKPGYKEREKNQRKDTGSSSPLDPDFSPEERRCVEFWNAYAVPSRLGFLNATIRTEALADALAGYCSSFEDFDRLVRWVVDREREFPTTRSKSLCRVLEDAYEGHGHFQSYDYLSQPNRP